MKTLTVNSLAFLFANIEGSDFSAFLSPLDKEAFKKVVVDAENKLRIVNQTLTLLDNVQDSSKFGSLLDEMLHSISLKIGQLLRADRINIFLFDEEKGEFWTNMSKDERGNAVELRISASSGVVGKVADSRKTVNISYDPSGEEQSGANLEFDEKTGYQTRTSLALPLFGENGELTAVIQLINKLDRDGSNGSLVENIDPKGFTAEDEELVQEFIPSLRLILESSRSLNAAMQKQRAATSLMKAISSLSQGGLDLEDTLKRVMDEAKELMHADRSTLWLLDREKGQLWTKIPIGGVLQEIRIPMAAGFAGQVATTGEPVNISFDLYNNPKSETAKQTDQKTGYRTCSLLCLPVFNTSNELIGVTQLINKKRSGDYPPYDSANWPKAPDCWKASFNSKDQEFMQAFNTQAGVALQNATLFATVKQQAQMQRDILRSLTNGVISIDKTGKVIAANESAKQLLSFDINDAIEGREVKDLVKIKEGDFEKWLDMALTAENEKARQQYYPEQTLISGETQHSINLSLNTMTDGSEEGKVSGALIVMDDISDEKRLKSTMYRYMSQDLAERLIQTGDSAKLGGDRKEVSVLFSDIRSYTTLTESMEAEEVVSMLNEYFESMVEAIFTHKGTLDKYIGDAMMAVFGSPLPLVEHAWCAVQAAIEMRHRLEAYNLKRLAANLQQLRVGIGINSDSVISGNIGSSKRMEFTAIGDGINLGSRLEGVSKLYGCDIIISSNTYALCKDQIWYRELDLIRVKGKNEPIAIYELVDVKEGPLSKEVPKQKLQAIDYYHKGRDLFNNRKFEQAIDVFHQALEIEKYDKAAILHIERCRHFLATPPESNWDGVWTYTEK
jgi:adenylate cyclase